MRINKLAAAMTGAGLLFVAIASQAPAFADAPASAEDEAVEAQLFKQHCTTCHLEAQATAERKSHDQWAETVDKMIGYGAAIPDEDYTRVLNYLTRHHGLETTTVAGNHAASLPAH